MNTRQGTPPCNAELAQKLINFDFDADAAARPKAPHTTAESYLKQQYLENMVRRFGSFEVSTEAELKTLRQRLNKQSTINLLLALSLLCTFVLGLVV